MSATLALQRAVFTKLRTNAGLAALLAEDTRAGSPTMPAIYDLAPQEAASEDDSKYPYVVIGDDTSTEFDTDDVNGQEHTITLHVFSRRRGRSQAKEILDAIYNALHDVSLTVTGHDAIYCFWEFSGSIPEPDGPTRHAVTRFRILTQQQ